MIWIRDLAAVGEPGGPAGQWQDTVAFSSTSSDPGSWPASDGEVRNYSIFIRRGRSKPEVISVPAVGLPGEQTNMAPSYLGNPLPDVAGGEEAIKGSEQPRTEGGEMKRMVPGKFRRIYPTQPLTILIPVAELGTSDANFRIIGAGLGSDLHPRPRFDLPGATLGLFGKAKRLI